MIIHFIGFGNMAKAMAKGLMQSPLHWTLQASHPSAKPDAIIDGVRCFQNYHKAIKEADIIVLAIKPHVMPTIWPRITEELHRDTLIVSIAAGLTTDWFFERYPKTISLVRAMPNMPVAIGKGATPMFASPSVTPTQKHWCEQLFSQMGYCQWIDNEDHLDILTALSGSGPAYVYLFIKSLIEGAVELGLPESIATNFTFSMLDGASRLAQKHHAQLQSLIEQVTSPKGTTESALRVLNEGEFAMLVKDALKAAAMRAQELRR